MKIQRKLLTDEQIKSICDKNYDDSSICNWKCPLKKKIGIVPYCIHSIKRLEQELRDYLDEEVEVSNGKE